MSALSHLPCVHLLPLHMSRLRVPLVSVLQAGIVCGGVAARGIPPHVLRVPSPNVGVLPLACVLPLCGGGQHSPCRRSRPRLRHEGWQGLVGVASGGQVLPDGALKTERIQGFSKVTPRLKDRKHYEGPGHK